MVQIESYVGGDRNTVSVLTQTSTAGRNCLGMTERVLYEDCYQWMNVNNAFESATTECMSSTLEALISRMSTDRSKSGG